MVYIDVDFQTVCDGDDGRTAFGVSWVGVDEHGVKVKVYEMNYQLNADVSWKYTISECRRICEALAELGEEKLGVG